MPARRLARAGEGNIDTPPSHICVNSVEMRVNNLADARDVGAFVERLHILTTNGNKVRELLAFCQLTGLKAIEIRDGAVKRYADATLSKVKVYD